MSWLRGTRAPAGHPIAKVVECIEPRGTQGPPTSVARAYSKPAPGVRTLSQH